MARRLLSPRAMSHQPYVVRRLRTRVHTPAELGGCDEMLPEVVAEQLRLSADEVASRLAQKWLRSTDLVLIGGVWTTLADAIPFAELAQPFARRERLLQLLKGAAFVLALLAVFLFQLFA